MYKESLTFYESNEFWVLIIGIVIGYLLNISTEYIKGKLSSCKKRKAIESELRTNLGLLPQKVDILKQEKESLEKGAILPSQSAHYQTYIYNAYIGAIASDLSDIQRENLHIIYEFFRGTDIFLDNLFKEFVECTATKVISDPLDAYKNMCEDLITRSALISDMIREYLAGKPRVVTW